MPTLDQAEGRVLGSLLEKQLATPQYYPLTLNALVAACNQSSNREPVTDYGEAEVADALAGLREKGLVRVVHSSGNRVPKYRHVLDDTWGLDDAHRAVLAVLLLRGPQTVGELRARTERLATFAGMQEIEEVLRLLSVREEPLARQQPRQPGQKEARHIQLLADEGGGELRGRGEDGGASPAEGAGSAREAVRGAGSLADRVAALEVAVAGLNESIAELKGLLD